MHFSTGIICVAVALFSFSAKADIIAFSGNSCDSSEGANVACDDACNAFANRHSFAVLASGTRCVTVFEDGGCNTPVGAITNGGSGQCSNVNTGTNVQSFRCSPNSFCDDVAAGKSLPTVAGKAQPAFASGST